MEPDVIDFFLTIVLTFAALYSATDTINVFVNKLRFCK